ncbi:MarR family winged helix-turn-helix transcriptional regulator [Streptomyces sp. H34-S4]|uniref:MarR family winged helix-turn-helix transcriptional regulator n=1 Tax=Streptomyces sp. H34-S4 TaxID=2996463 RepID=UPI002272256F|nr:MarR family winged helix-turn-helix transcriptional regulator [Streptomyces sp. H34-S4]MCY0934004.1 MarR family winged helix-turn-helix transcriptional regulator [Streptomyces sp. H34-S4]
MGGGRIAAQEDEGDAVGGAELLDQGAVPARLRELVERTPDPADRRRNVITLAAAGRRRLRKLEQLLDAAQEEFLSPLSSQACEQLTRLLGRLVAHHSRSGPTMGADDR